MKKHIILIFSLTFMFSVNAQVKKILLEEMTTTLCGFCPPKSIDLQRLADSVPEAVVVVHHAGFGKDAMTNPAATTFAQAFAPGHFPSMTIDRIKFDSAPGYYTKYVGVSMMAFKWADTVFALLQRSDPKAIVMIDRQYNASERRINGQVKVRFLKIPSPGDLRITLYVLEDSVVGDTGKYDYDQKNYITNDPKYPELYGKSVIYYKAHNDVLRAAPLGEWGVAGVIPSSPQTGVDYTKDFDYQLPVKYDTLKGRTVDPERIYLVAFVSYYNSDTWKRQVINAEKVKLISTSALNENVISGSLNPRLFPNPATQGYTHLKFSLLRQQKLEASLFDPNGRRILGLMQGIYEPGDYTLKINTGLLENGIYLLRLISEDEVVTTKIHVLY